MKPLSPYRSLPADRRVALVLHDISTNRESRDGYVRRIVARGGGFRLETVRKRTSEQLAREIVRYGLETIQDEVGLLRLLYVELEPELQIAFLDATGVKHEGAQISDELETPFADAATVRAAALALIKDHGEEARRYLRTIALYNAEAWPGLNEVLHLADGLDAP
jgi:hypothetical protein